MLRKSKYLYLYCFVLYYKKNLYNSLSMKQVFKKCVKWKNIASYYFSTPTLQYIIKNINYSLMFQFYNIQSDWVEIYCH